MQRDEESLCLRRTCFVIPSVMSTLLFKQLTHVFAGLA